MALETDIRHHAVPKWRHHEIEFRLLHGALYPVFLTTSVLTRLMPWRWLARNAPPRRSIFQEAKASTDKIVPMLFMG